MGQKTYDKNPGNVQTVTVRTMPMSTAVLGMAVALMAGIFIGAMMMKYLGATPVMVAQPVQQQTQMPQQQAPAIDPQLEQQIHRLAAQVTENPQDYQAWTNLAHLYFDTNQVTHAIQAYNRSLELRPNNADVWTDLGVMYRRDHQHEKALECFANAIAIDPQHETAYYNTGIVYRYDMEDEQAALAAWEALLEINPQATTPNGQPLAEVVESMR